MTNLIKILLFFISLTVNVHGQTINKNDSLELKSAKEFLKSALTDSTKYKEINSKYTVITEKEQAIKYAEQILFGIYGEKQIQNERPYKVFYIDKYWILWGTQPQATIGGTFLIIIDSHNGRVIEVTHGK